MNFPDLEICKAIAKEFLESEFVYISFQGETWDETVRRDRITSDENKDYLEYHNRGTTFCGIEIEAPAPNCEELGKWLHKSRKPLKPTNRDDNSYHYGLKCHSGDYFVLYYFSCYHGERELSFDIEGATETQARAEAVKFILEAK